MTPGIGGKRRGGKKIGIQGEKIVAESDEDSVNN